MNKLLIVLKKVVVGFGFLIVPAVPFIFVYICSCLSADVAKYFFRIFGSCLGIVVAYFVGDSMSKD